MRWKIRQPFVVHHEKVIEREQGGRKIKEGVVESHYDGEELELNEADALKHLHKLEPLDKDAKAFLQTRYDANAAIANQRTGDAGSAFPGLAEAIAAGVAKALKDLGVQAPAAAAPGPGK